MLEEEETPRIHPDGLPVNVTPECDWFKENGHDISDTTRGFECRARTAEADLAEMKDRAEKAERTVAWLRSGGHNRFNNYTVHGNGTLGDVHITAESVRAHLASNPPEDWKP